MRESLQRLSVGVSIPVDTSTSSGTWIRSTVSSINTVVLSKLMCSMTKPPALQLLGGRQQSAAVEFALVAISMLAQLQL